ncbi:MAG: hypothetical protein M3Y57_22425 [Acidobacteriota bacterium]|nr:hypothetical protein [Acidobacteriota bacterium]
MKSSRISLLAAFAVAAIISIVPAVAGPGHGGGGGHGGHHSSGSTVHVNSYSKKNGEYVQQHHRTSPNGTQRDNWSAQGNANPETGKEGTKPIAH